MYKAASRRASSHGYIRCWVFRLGSTDVRCDAKRCGFRVSNRPFYRSAIPFHPVSLHVSSCGAFSSSVSFYYVHPKVGVSFSSRLPTCAVVLVSMHTSSSLCFHACSTSIFSCTYLHFHCLSSQRVSQERETVRRSCHRPQLHVSPTARRTQPKWKKTRYKTMDNERMKCREMESAKSRLQ